MDNEDFEIDELNEMFNTCNTRNSQEEYNYLWKLYNKIKCNTFTIDEIQNTVNYYLRTIDFSYCISKPDDINKIQYKIKENLLYIKNLCIPASLEVSDHWSEKDRQSRFVNENTKNRIRYTALITFKEMIDIIENTPYGFRKK